MDDYVLPSKLLSQLSHAAEIIRSHDFINVYSHYDADGISAASIIGKTLLREGKDFKITLFTTLNDENMDVIKNSKAKCVILTDLGSSYIKELDDLTCDVVVLDHHTIQDEAKRVCYINPHLYGVDGMTSGCGSTMSFLLSATMNENNWDLVPIAFAGLVGDRQHINGLLGLNIHLLNEGVKKGHIKIMEGSVIPLGLLNSELFLSTDPYVRGVSGNENGVIKLLSDANVDQKRTYNDLTSDEKRKLSSMITLKLIAQGVSLQTLIEVSRTRYYLPAWNMDAESFASILDGCGRLGLGGIGVSTGIGDSKSLEESKELEIKSRKQIVDGALIVDRMGLTEMEHIQWFSSTELGFTGVICGIAMQFIGKPEKPTIGINKSNNLAKISSRGMWIQLDKGIDLAVALREACESVGGQGGGHKIASGGACDISKTNEFLLNLDKIIECQLNSAK